MALGLTLISVGGAGMLVLLAHRHFESTRGLRTAVHDLREKADPILRDAHRTTGRALSHITLRNAVLAANIAFVHVVRLFVVVSSKVHRISSDIVDKASKKTEDLSRGGAASFYLKKIKEDKEKNQGISRVEGE